ncbi:hypothetical protein KR044_009974, partial [Drosophila immigrans]
LHKMSSSQVSEMSKTYQYRKVMKPLLERKRRARINKCLFELKDLMVATLESDGEHVTRLEKADILELTITHLQKLKQQRQHKRANGGDDTLTPAEGFRSGYIHAVNEVSRSLSQLPGMNVSLGTQLMTHLGQRLNQLQPAVKEVLPVTSPLSVHIASRDAYSVPISPISSYAGSPNSSVASEHLLTTCSSSLKADEAVDSEDEENVWRPW